MTSNLLPNIQMYIQMNIHWNIEITSDQCCSLGCCDRVPIEEGDVVDEQELFVIICKLGNSYVNWSVSMFMLSGVRCLIIMYLFYV